ncbi:hypothetical protein H1R20_g903, partial [Candolleomyces eurysporus]
MGRKPRAPGQIDFVTQRIPGAPENPQVQLPPVASSSRPPAQSGPIQFEIITSSSLLEAPRVGVEGTGPDEAEQAVGGSGGEAVRSAAPALSRASTAKAPLKARDSLSAVDMHIMSCLQDLRAHRLGPFNVINHILDGNSKAFGDYQDKFYTEDNENLDKILMAIANSHKGRKKLA